MKTKRAFVNTAFIIAYQILNLLMGLVLPKLYTETFGSAYNGLHQTITQIMHWLALLQAGLAAASTQALFKPIAEKKKDEIWSVIKYTQSQYAKMGIWFVILLSAIAIVWGIIGSNEISGTLISYFLIMHGVSSAVEYFFLAKYSIYLSAANKNFVVYIVSIIILLVSSALRILVLLLTKNIYLYQSILLIGVLIRCVILFFVCRKDFKDLKANTPEIKKVTMAQRRDVLISEIAGFVISSTDVLIISSFMGFAYSSIYSVYAFVMSGITNILGSIREGVYSGMWQLLFTDKERFKKVFSSFETIYLTITFMLFTIAAIAYRSFITVYTAKMDMNYVFLIYPMLFVLAQVLVNLRIPAIMATNSAGHFKQVKKYAVAEAIINLVLSLALVKPLGIAGVLIGTICGGLYRTPVYVNYCNKHVLERKNIKYIKKVALLGVPFLIGLALSFVDWHIQTFMQWFVFAAITGVIVALVYVSILWLMEKEYIKNTFLKKLKFIRR